MSQEEQDRVVGELVRELDREKKLLVCYRSKSARIAQVLRGAAQQLDPGEEAWSWTDWSKDMELPESNEIIAAFNGMRDARNKVPELTGRLK